MTKAKRCCTWLPSRATQTLFRCCCGMVRGGFDLYVITHDTDASAAAVPYLSCSDLQLIKAACSSNTSSQVPFININDTHAMQCRCDAKREADERTALHVACECGSAEAAEALLAAGASLTAVDFDGSTALGIACQYGCLTIVQLLLSKGATVSSGPHLPAAASRA
jgi:hypothetical protein